MSYTHLTEDERYHIYEGKVHGKSVRQIAAQLQRSPSSVSRELRRNCGGRGYRPAQAQCMRNERRRQSCNAARISPAVWTCSAVLLREYYSPEQVSGRLAEQGLGRISHETVYKRVYVDKENGGDLHTYLRCKRKRRKRYGSCHARRGVIPNRVGIEQRPLRVENRGTFGHWEGDTIVGKGGSRAIVSLVERKSRYTILRPVRRKTSEEVCGSIIASMDEIPEMMETLTLDNGLEFAGHELISRCLKATTYFAKPYASWQRGLNENTNGLVRQFHPKKSCFKGNTAETIQRTQDYLNHRPRKCLGWRTPYEVFSQAAKERGVALQA